ncbi:MAG: chromate transporter [Armatimonadetes bacterium]|nr:chromate transporter [Armatimonadota bacterium]
MRDILLLAAVCAKVGALAFGGGMGMLPLLHADVVTRYGWLTEKQFMDGVALGQITPGPVMVAATFVGWKVGGVLGAIVATVAIFSPSAIMTALVAWQLSRWRQSPWLRGFLGGVRPAIAGLVGALALRFARVALFLPAHPGLALDWAAVVVCIGALIALLKFRIDPALVFLSAAVIGLLWY